MQFSKFWDVDWVNIADYVQMKRVSDNNNKTRGFLALWKSVLISRKMVNFQGDFWYIITMNAVAMASVIFWSQEMFLRLSKWGQKESCQSQGNCLKIGTFKKLVSRNLDKSREKAQIVSIVSELFEILSCWIWKFDVKIESATSNLWIWSCPKKIESIWRIQFEKKIWKTCQIATRKYVKEYNCVVCKRTFITTTKEKESKLVKSINCEKSFCCQYVSENKD